MDCSRCQPQRVQEARCIATVTRLLLGRAWPVVTGLVLTVLIVTLETGMGRGGTVAFAEAAVRAAIVLLALSRFGLLSCAAAMGSYSILTTVQPTLLTDTWFSGPRLVVLAALGAIAAWAFVAALGGRRLLPDAGAA